MAFVALAAIVACGASTKQAGGLEVFVRTNLTPTADFDKLRVEVEQESSPGGSWNKVFDLTEDVPGGVTLPTTVSITAGSSPDQLARVTAWALLGSTVVVQDIAEVQVPTDRVGRLDILLSQECVGKTCPSGDTCDPNSGACVSNVVTVVPTLDGGSTDDDASTSDAGSVEMDTGSPEGSCLTCSSASSSSASTSTSSSSGGTISSSSGASSSFGSTGSTGTTSSGKGATSSGMSSGSIGTSSSSSSSTSSSGTGGNTTSSTGGTGTSSGLGTSSSSGASSGSGTSSGIKTFDAGLPPPP